MPLSFCLEVFHHLLKRTPALLGITVLSCPAIALADCSEQTNLSMAGIERLQGQSYVSLPQEVCPQYTDVLLGRFKQQEYSSVVCEHSKNSYILLQKFVKYTEQGKAVWKIVYIKRIPKPSPQSFVKAMGCRINAPDSGQPNVPIFALVKPSRNETYLTLAAWRVDLGQTAFFSLSPAQVVCEDIQL